eukprot:scaffold16407_cov127-Isochrysis_galbana.AAC.5
MVIEKIYPLDAVFDTAEDVPADVLANKRGRLQHQIRKRSCNRHQRPSARSMGMATAARCSTRKTTGPATVTGARVL